MSYSFYINTNRVPIAPYLFKMDVYGVFVILCVLFGLNSPDVKAWRRRRRTTKKIHQQSSLLMKKNSIPGQSLYILLFFASFSLLNEFRVKPDRNSRRRVAGIGSGTHRGWLR